MTLIEHKTYEIQCNICKYVALPGGPIHFETFKANFEAAPAHNLHRMKTATVEDDGYKHGNVHICERCEKYIYETYEEFIPLYKQRPVESTEGTATA